MQILAKVEEESRGVNLREVSFDGKVESLVISSQKIRSRSGTRVKKLESKKENDP